MTSCLLPFLDNVFAVVTIFYVLNFSFIGILACCLFCYKYVCQSLLSICLRYSWSLSCFFLSFSKKIMPYCIYQGLILYLNTLEGEKDGTNLRKSSFSFLSFCTDEDLVVLLSKNMLQGWWYGHLLFLNFNLPDVGNLLFLRSPRKVLCYHAFNTYFTPL